MAKNPYEILGIKKDASDADIKLAYHKLAKKHHPDLNPGNRQADEKFKELNAANDLLTDKNKRASFDRGEIDFEGKPNYQQQQRNYKDYAEGPQGSRYNYNGADFDMSDLESLFGSFGGRARNAGPQPPTDAHYTIEVDFLEAARGTKKRITMPDGKTLDINIPEGIEEGQQLRLKGQGTKPSGDAYVKIQIKPHQFFSRKGNDINIELPITLPESVLGGKIKAPTIHGAVDMAISKNSSPGTTLRLKGKGIKTGDQYVKLKLVMPKDIDAELEEAIRKWSEKNNYNPRKTMEAAI